MLRANTLLTNVCHLLVSLGAGGVWSGGLQPVCWGILIPTSLALSPLPQPLRSPLTNYDILMLMLCCFSLELFFPMRLFSLMIFCFYIYMFLFFFYRRWWEAIMNLNDTKYVYHTLNNPASPTVRVSINNCLLLSHVRTWKQIPR